MGKKYTLDGILNLCNGNGKFMNEFLSLFIETTPDYMQEAIKAATSGNWGEVTSILHKLKPTVEMFAMEITPFLKNTHEQARDRIDTDQIPGKLETINAFFTEVLVDLKKDLEQYPKE